MSGDGILMNFEISDAPIIPKPIFQGGRWRDRLIAKKCAAKREGRGSSNLSEREIFRQKATEETEEYIGHEGSPKSSKRRRIDQETTNPNHIIVVKEKHEGSKFIGSGEQKITAGESLKLKKNVAVNNDTRSAFISGKLPAGSIINLKGGGLTNGPSKKIVFDDTSGNDFKANQNTKNTNGRASTNPKKPGQIISSLFSYNPSATTACEKQEQDIPKIEPSNAPLTAEMETFTALGLSARLAAHLSTKLSMMAPTAIQKAAIPIMIKDQDDAFIQAETGSGKTLAYLLPIVHRIIAMSDQGIQVHRDSGLFAIVLAPTRELCKQIASVLDKLLRCAPWIVGTTVIGGESKQSEKARIRKGVNILIATPGRLSDHLESTEVLKTDKVRWFVMDEGDRLMELGFEEEIKKIVEKLNQTNSAKSTSNFPDNKSLPRRRVTILCSATMKMNVQRLGEISLKDAVHIVAHKTSEKESKEIHQIEDQPKKFSAPAQLKQAYAIVPAKLRLVTLTAILKRAFVRRGSVMKAIVFISCADSVDFHFSLFSRPMEASSENEGKLNSQPASVSSEITKDTIAQGTTFSSETNTVNLYRLHGSLPQNVRTATLKAFTLSPEPCVLICTDVASRGLDLPNVDYVIEYDPPFGADDHLHRVGRTARAGRDGRALIFLLPGEEEEYISVLASGYREGKKALVSNTAEELLRKGFGGTGKEWEERATNWQLEVERWVQDSPKYLEMARRGFQSHIRAYATHVASERHIFNMQTLHLGHLAKAFALRDKPGSIKVPGLRPAKASKADRSALVRKLKKGEVDNVAPEGERIRKQKKLELDMPKVDIDDASKRMRKKIQQHMSAVTEFNIM
ncbi:ATP-dependent RNA helicase dbp7 [Golovinomyces cichoracearum]|uniref:ATP-dependent RNA helicase n=1 Tax=Golovinomyces cichoracearum TaxID=62708 RepID=A0A420IV71_9PEZI|nr:ATP-dependent RNA helicase dbp7 [Golovinomyces cichoracearum]